MCWSIHLKTGHTLNWPDWLCKNVHSEGKIMTLENLRAQANIYNLCYWVIYGGTHNDGMKCLLLPH